MRKTATIILIFVIFQACSVYHSMSGKNKCITNYYGEGLENYSKYSFHSELSSEIIYLAKDSSYYFESQGEGRGLWFSFGQYKVNDSTLALEHNEIETREYILDYKSDKRNTSVYTPFLTLDFLKNSGKSEVVKKELPAFFIFDNYEWKIKTNNKLERKLRGSSYFANFKLEQLNGYVMVNDTLLSPGIHVINGEKYKTKHID